MPPGSKRGCGESERRHHKQRRGVAANQLVQVVGEVR